MAELLRTGHGTQFRVYGLRESKQRWRAAMACVQVCAQTPPSLRRRWNGSIALRSSSTAGDAARANGQLEGLLGEAQRLLSAKEEADEDVRREEEGRHGGKADCRCEMEHRAHDLKVELALSVISQLSHVAARSGLFEGPRFPHLLRGLTHQVDFTVWILSTHVTC